MDKKLDKLKAQLGLVSGADIAAPPPKPEASPSPTPLPPVEGANPELKGLRAKLGLLTGEQMLARREELDRRREAGEMGIEHIVPGQVVENDEGAFYLVRKDYPLDYAQGSLPLGAALDSAAEQIAFSAADDALLDFDPRRTLFIDTETTGLTGGAGTVAFLIGVGYFAEDHFRLDQCFMRDYDEEAAMLRFLSGLGRDYDTLVSYNGKSFDLPLLRTRFIQNRIPFPYEAAMHYDLVHAARRFWRRRLGDCSLGNIEREVLGVRRVDDVPSYLIPQLYFDYLNANDASPLEGVFYHHRTDILSLASLTGHVSQCLSRPDGFDHAEDQLSVVRLHYRQKGYAQVVVHGKRFLDGAETNPLCRECLEMIGMAHKRLGQFEEVQAAFERLLDAFPSDLTARVELAKLHEHRTRNLAEARRLCEEALQHYYTQLSLDRPTDLSEGVAKELQYRLDRIKKKMGRGGE